jgi:predicted DNA-binding transcriptional regulator AlpA
VARNAECSTNVANRLLFSVRETCEALHISERSLWSLSTPRGPIPVVRIGRSVRYDPRDLQQWIDERKTGGVR